MKVIKDGCARHEIPETTDTELWIEDSGSISLAEILEEAQNKWPNVKLEQIEISPVKHHQYNIYYDLYDPSDYVDYIVLSI